MKSTIILFAHLFGLLAVAAPAYSVTLVDGDFSSWTLGSAGNGTAFTTLESTGGNPGARLNINTITPTSTTRASGTAIKTDFSDNTPINGNTFALSLDFLSGPGAFGQGQSIGLLIAQGGSVYTNGSGIGLGVTGVSPNYKTITFTGSFIESQFTRLTGSGSLNPDFVSGVSTSFGFAATNSGSNNLTQYYDNFRLETFAVPTAVPEPFTIIGTLVGGTAALRMRKKLKASAD